MSNKNNRFFGGRPVQQNFQQPMIAPGIQPGVTFNSLRKISCSCGGEIFVPTSSIFYASPLQTMTGQGMIVNQPGGFTCAVCGKTNSFDSATMKDLKIPIPVDQDIPSSDTPPSNNVNN